MRPSNLINARTVETSERAPQTYEIIAPPTPGATPRWVAGADSLAEAEEKAAAFCADRRDLNNQDVRIQYAASGRLVRRAGPNR